MREEEGEKKEGDEEGERKVRKGEEGEVEKR